MIPELEVVELTCDLPKQGLKQGDSGTIVFVHPPSHYIVEFMTPAGETIALVTVSQEQIRPVFSGDAPHARLVETQG